MDNECATRLEVEFVVMRRDMGEIKTDQRESRKDMAGIRNILAKLPTSERLFGYTATVAALAFAVVAVIVSILAYIGAFPHP